jgi:DNA-binding SARP family transcriptional activator
VNDVCIHLFGRFTAECLGQPIRGLDGGKVNELFCYLLLHRARPHPREALADLLWNNIPAFQSKKHLRQVLWQMNSVLDPYFAITGVRLMLIEPDWIYVNPCADLWIDVAAFELACDNFRGIAGHALNTQQAQTLIDAVALYRGDLLEGCYLDWCLFERERLHNLCLAALDRLMDYCETHGQYEAAICFGDQILRRDQARECTHRRLMRLYFLAGDRTEALRQYDRCAEILQQELAVKPAASTVALHEQIRSGRMAGKPSPARTIQHLEHVLTLLADAQAEVQREILELEGARTG